MKIFFVRVLQLFRAYGAAGDRFNAPAKAEAQRQRRDIFVEYPSQKKIQPQRGGIFGKSFFAGFENVLRVVFHTEFLQQCDDHEPKMSLLTELNLFWLGGYNYFAPGALPGGQFNAPARQPASASSAGTGGEVNFYPGGRG